MKKMLIIIGVIIGLIIWADSIIDNEINNIDTNEQALNLEDNVNTSATPNGAISFQNITTISTSTFGIPIVIEEANVSEVTILDTTMLSNVPADAKNTIEEQNGKLQFKEYGTDSGNTKLNNILVSGNVLIQVPIGSKLDYDLDSFGSPIELNAMSDNLNIEAFDISESKVLKGGNNLEINGLNGVIDIYEAFNNIEIDCMHIDANLVVNANTKQVVFSSLNTDAIIEIEDNAPYMVSKNGLAIDILDSYSNVASNGINIEVNSMNGNLVLDDWR